MYSTETFFQTDIDFTMKHAPKHSSTTALAFNFSEDEDDEKN